MNAAASPLLDMQSQLHRQTRSRTGPLDQLMPWIVDRRNLDAAWDRARKRDGASTPGVDGLTAPQVEGRVGDWITQISAELTKGRFTPKSPRYFDIPKPHKPGETRRMGILTLKDHVVHAAIEQVVEPILDRASYDGGFGFRPGHELSRCPQDLERLRSQDSWVADRKAREGPLGDRRLASDVRQHSEPG